MTAVKSAGRHADGGDWGGLLLSLLLHGGLAGLIVYGSMVLPGFLLGGSRPAGGPAAIQAGLVSALPSASVPLPAQTSAPTENRLATDLPAEGISRPEHRAAAPTDAVPLPERLRTQQLQQQQLALERDRIAESETKPDDRTPVGGGGPVSGNYGPNRVGATPAAGAGMTTGDAAFGAQYGDWLNALKDRLTYFFSQQYQPPGAHGSLVTVSFRVTHAGLVQRVDLIRSSGLPQADRMAMGAVQQMAGNQTFPLPATYAKGFLDITVTFEIP